MPAMSEILARELPTVDAQVPLAPLCAYGVGGPAEFFYVASTTESLRHAAVVGRELGLRVTVLGCGTNVLISDDGLGGLVIAARNGDAVIDGERVTAGAGAVLPELVTTLAERGLAGLEFAGNIPGSVGGAVVGNAGAYGRAVGDVLVSARVLAGGEESTATPADLDLGYRTSALKGGRGAVVLSAVFRVHGGDRNALLDEIARDAALRRSKHPLEYASCGSYFKNPSRELPAARLIEEAGLKGARLGRAEVSEKHANFLVARGGAGSEDIRRLAAQVKRQVHESSGVWLEEEVTQLGFDTPAP